VGNALFKYAYAVLGKLLVKVMRIFTALLPKKVTNCITLLLFMESNVMLLLHYFFSAGLACLFFINKKRFYSHSAQIQMCSLCECFPCFMLITSHSIKSIKFWTRLQMLKLFFLQLFLML